MSKVLFVSDIHGNAPELETELKGILERNEIPNLVFFLGDIVGNPLLDVLQRKFYAVFNKMKTLTEADDEEILGAVYIECCDLEEYLKKIDCGLFCVDNHTKWAKEISKYSHFGHFISNLPLEIRNILKNGLEENAKTMIDIMSDFVDAGSMVVVTEGNWDARTPLDFYPTDECRPLPIEERSFYLKDYIMSLDREILYFNEISSIEIENTIFRILPFDACINYIPGTFVQEKTEKNIILVSHTQVLWSAIKGETPMTTEGKKIEENMKIILQDLLPDAVVHGHLHDSASDYNVFLKEKPVMVHYLPMRTARFIDFM